MLQNHHKFPEFSSANAKAGIRIGACLALLSLAFSCATIFSDNVYRYEFDSKPQGAQVTMFLGNMHQQILFTPFELELNLKYQYKFKFELPGYKSHIVQLEKDYDLWLLGSVPFAPFGIGAIGILTDALTGSIYKPLNNMARVFWSFEPVEGPTKTLPEKNQPEEKKPGETKPEDTKPEDKKPAKKSGALDVYKVSFHVVYPSGKKFVSEFLMEPENKPY